MDCLSCGEQMVNNTVAAGEERVSYDICESCGGLWLDAGELDKMAFQVEGSIEFSSAETAEDVTEAPRECPRCQGELLEKVHFVGYSDIILDRCANCGGFWLDGGELDRINRELEQIMPVAGKGFSEFVSQVQVPYWHQRLRRPSSETDFQVDVPPLPGAERIEETDYPCPACPANLSVYEAFGIRLEGCAMCRGLWLEHDRLRKLKDKALREPWTDLQWLDDEIEAIKKARAMPSQRRCPKCEDQKMVSAALGGSEVVVDWCPSCGGVWLDQAEFRAILRRLRSKWQETSSEEMKEKVYEEIREVWDGPEGMVEEMRDAKAAISALLNALIFEHPRLVKFLESFGRAAGSIGQ